MSKYTLLIVDDDYSMRQMLNHQLKRAGFNIVDCGSGEEALDLLEESKYDLLLTDYRMDNMDGLFLIEMCRKVGNEIPIILMTAIELDESAKNILILYEAAYYSKSSDIQKLIDLIDGQLT